MLSVMPSLRAERTDAAGAADRLQERREGPALSCRARLPVEV